MRTIHPSKLTTTNTLLAPTGTVVVVKTIPSSSSSSSSNAPHSPWQTPIPYLFGGLATIMGLIAFALVMLGCSYWRLATTPSQDSNLAENNSKESDDPQNKKPYKEKILVIMAGEDKPTFLATPLYPNSLSLGNNFHLGDSEDSDRSLKEIMHNHVVLLPPPVA